MPAKAASRSRKVASRTGKAARSFGRPSAASLTVSAAPVLAAGLARRFIVARFKDFLLDARLGGSSQIHNPEHRKS